MFYGEFSGHDVNMGKGEQKISLSSVSRGLVTQMSDTLIHKKQVQQKRYKKVYFNQIHGRKKKDA